MQQCLICGSCVALELSSYAEHYRRHERKRENIQFGRLCCAFCDTEYPNVEGLLYHLITYHQVPHQGLPRSVPQLAPRPRDNAPGARPFRSGPSQNSPVISLSKAPVNPLENVDKKVDEALKTAKSKIDGKLHEIIQDYKNNMFISDHVTKLISHSLRDTTSLILELLGDVVKACSSKSQADKITKLRDDILLSFTEDSQTNENSNGVKHEFSSTTKVVPISEFSLDLPPTTSSAAPVVPAAPEISFDPMTFSNLFHSSSGGGVIALDPAKPMKAALKSLANEMLDVCQEFYDQHTPRTPITFCDIDIYEEFDSPHGRLILYIISNDSNPDFANELINIGYKESYGYLRNILRATNSSLDFRPRELDPLVSGYLTIIGKEGPSNEIIHAETKKILHAWIRTTRHRAKESEAIINSEPGKILIRKKRKAPSDEGIEALAEEAQKMMTDLGKCKQLFRGSAQLRLDWMSNTPGIDVEVVMQTFPCIQMFPKQLIDIDYEELCNNRKWERISIVEEMQRILPALKDLLQSYNITTLSVDLNQNDTYANVFLSLPDLFHHFLNSSRKIPKQFYFEIESLDFQDGVNQVKNEVEDEYNFLGRITTPNGQIIFVYVNGYAMRIEGSILEALEFYYRIHNVFRIDFPTSLFFLASWLDLLCRKKIETNAGPQRLMREIERLCKQYQDFPETRSPGFF